MAARKKPTTIARPDKARSHAIEQPSVRTYQVWTPAQIRSAELAADAGHLRQAVDLCDWLLTDDKVRGSLDGRLNGFLGLPITFEQSGDKRRSARTVKALEAGEDWWAMFPEAQARAVNAWALLLGIGPGVMRWHVLEEHGGRDVPILDFYHPQSIGYDFHERTWFRELTDGAGSGREAIQFGDGVWLGHMPFGSFRPWAWGFWRSLARWVLLKAYAVSDYGRLGEIASRDVIEIEKDADDNRRKRLELASDISRMGRDGIIVLPPGYHHELVETTAGTAGLFKQQIDLADQAISIQIRGGNLLSQVKEGSRAAAEVQERRGDLGNAKNDASAWSDTTRSQGLRYWAFSNFGNASLAPWPVYKTDPDEDKKVKADTMVLALQGAKQAEDLGFKLKRKEFADAFGLAEFLEPGEPKPPEPPPAPAPPEPPAPTPPPAPQDDPPPEPGARQARAGLRLASGATLAEAAGFIDGQLYADALVERGVEAAREALEETLAAVREELDAATDYDDLRQRLRARYEKLDPEALNQIIFAAMALGEHAGRAAFDQDV
jgi:hypothetical protein